MEYAINNTANRFTGKNPSQLVFGLDQQGLCIDQLRELLTDKNDLPDRNLETIRDETAQRILQSQQQNKVIYDKKHKTPRQYKQEDLVMIRNFDSTLGMSRKMISQFQGPYEVTKILEQR